MVITLYNTSSDSNVVHKYVTQVANMEGTLRNESNVVRPRVLIESSTLPECNYAYIPEFSRYYYITEIEAVRNGLFQINLKSDVLMSFSLMGSTGILQESERVINPYLPSRGFVKTCKTKTDILQFPSGLLETGEYILITAGGIL